MGGMSSSFDLRYVTLCMYLESQLIVQAETDSLWKREINPILSRVYAYNPT
jgi:hypothetical protein